MTFFKKNIVKERAYELFDVYVSEMMSIDPAFKMPISKQNLYGLFFELLYCLDPLSVDETVVYRKIVKSVKYRQRYPSSLDGRKSEYVEKYLIEKLIDMPCNVELSTEGRALAISNILERVSSNHDLHEALSTGSKEHSKPDVEPLHVDYLRRGTIYAGSIHEYIDTAISLNRDVMNSGSVWVFESGDAKQIKAQIMEACGVPCRNVVIHDENSGHLSGFKFTFSYVDELLSQIVLNHCPDIEDESRFLLYCRFIAVVQQELDPFYLGWWLAVRWGDVVDKVKLAIENERLSDYALGIVHQVLGENFSEASSKYPSEPEGWSDLYYLVRPYLRLLSTRHGAKCTAASINEKGAGGIHHIFVGKTFSELAILNFAELKGSPPASSKPNSEEPEERVYTPFFFEFKKFITEGFLIMPAASRGLSQFCPNVFVHEDFLDLDGASEEFSSLKANCMVKVTKFDGSMTDYERFHRKLEIGGGECFALSRGGFLDGVFYVSPRFRIVVV